ncbi:hypothetical protein BJ986_002923 [Phycicoccus badiiscoriae]|uniref:Uncharacterized protein n=1 Tax=Pedococcus badiiscoriae TaxID=642776 RepID=A0A852WT38_9MICO|nr:hypothetical protein [Pedococcus badiiscoriae]NYG08436.1 hypothetical protein [Pedococcus badiiscoriae]
MLTRKRLSTELFVLLTLLTVMVDGPVLMGGEAVTDSAVLVFAVGWIVVRGLSLPISALWRRHNPEHPWERP